MHDAATAPDEAGRRREAEAGLVAVTAIWAVNFSVIKAGLGEVEPYAFNALRFPLAALLLGVVASRRRRALPRRADVPRLVGLGLLGNVVYQLFFINGIDRTLAGNASVLLAITPVLTALLSSLLGHERLPLRVWVGVFATVAGIALVVGSGRTIRMGGETLFGDTLMIGAAAAWSLYTVGARDLIRRYGALSVTAWTLWVGTPGLVLLGIPDLLRTDLAGLPPGAWAAVAYAGALGIGVAYLLWYFGVRHLGNTRTATAVNLVPVVALAVAWLWLGEVPTVRQVTGAAIIILGVSLARRRT